MAVEIPFLKPFSLACPFFLGIVGCFLHPAKFGSKIPGTFCTSCRHGDVYQSVGALIVTLTTIMIMRC